MKYQLMSNFKLILCQIHPQVMPGNGQMNHKFNS